MRVLRVAVSTAVLLLFLATGCAVKTEADRAASSREVTSTAGLSADTSSAESSPPPVAEGFSDEEQVRSAAAAFVKALGAPGPRKRLRPLMTESAYAKREEGDERLVVKSFAISAVTALSPEEAFAEVSLEVIERQLSTGETETVRETVDMRLRLVKAPDGWLVSEGGDGLIVLR